MKIQCRICGPLGPTFEVIEDVLDKQLGTREASDKLIKHINEYHVRLMGNVAARLHALGSLAGWYFVMQEFCLPVAECEPELKQHTDTVLSSIQQIVNNEVAATMPGSGVQTTRRMPN